MVNEDPAGPYVVTARALVPVNKLKIVNVSKIQIVVLTVSLHGDNWVFLMCISVILPAASPGPGRRGELHYLYLSLSLGFSIFPVELLGTLPKIILRGRL